MSALAPFTGPGRQGIHLSSRFSLPGGAMKQILCLLSMVVFCSLSASAFAQDANERLNALEDAVKNQSKTIEEQQKTIDTLKDEIDKQKGQEPKQNGEEESSQSPKVSG